MEAEGCSVFVGLLVRVCYCVVGLFTPALFSLFVSFHDRQTLSLIMYLCLLGETNYGGGSNEEICARRQQPHHILLR